MKPKGKPRRIPRRPTPKQVEQALDLYRTQAPTPAQVAARAAELRKERRG